MRFRHSEESFATFAEASPPENFVSKWYGKHKRKSVHESGRIFVCIIHYSIFIINYSFGAERIFK
jgi:hypothetical protein